MKANQTTMETSQTRFGALQIGILLLGLVTLAIHLLVLNFQIYNTQGHIDVLFTPNGIGYLALLAAYFLPIPIAQNNRNLVRWIFIGYTALTILAWVVMGERNALGYTAKIVEVALIVLLWLDRR